MKKIKEYCRKQVKWHEETQKKGVVRDFVDMYLEQIGTENGTLSGMVDLLVHVLRTAGYKELNVHNHFFFKPKVNQIFLNLKTYVWSLKPMGSICRKILIFAPPQKKKPYIYQ